MSEHKEPIPSMIYNTAVGGHVTTSQQIIDETLNKEQSVLNTEQQELNKGILEEKTYTSGSDSGMGRVVLRKNLVEGVNTLVQTMINKSNTIYIIQYDFTLGEDITVPDNCVLEFDGGSIKNTSGNSYTIDFNNCVIKADYKVLDSIFPLQDSEFWHEINPKWFGVIDDGITDCISALNYMMSFVSKIKKTKFTFRHFGKTVPIIKFNTTGPIKISSPFEITIACKILGFPTFYYTGTHTELSGAIVINNGWVGGKYELNVTSKIDNSTVDLSDNITFAGVHIKSQCYGEFEFEEIHGFNSGIILCGSQASQTAACLRIYPRRISYCLNAVYVAIYNNNWPNEIELYGCQFGGGTQMTLPSGFDNDSGSFIRVVGDGSYEGNSWHIHDCAIEGKFNDTYNVNFINYLVPNKAPLYWIVDNIRAEHVGNVFLRQKSNGGVIRVSNIHYSEYTAAKYIDRDVTIDISSTIASYLGFSNSSGKVITNNKVINLKNTNETSGLVWRYSLFNSPKINTTTGSWSFVIKIKPKQFIGYRCQENNFNGDIAICSESSWANKNPVSSIPSDIATPGGFYKNSYPDYNTEQFNRVNSSARSSALLFNNSTTTTYYIVATSQGSLAGTIEFDSNDEIEIMSQ